MVNSNVEISLASINEFIRILLPEIQDKNIFADFEFTKENIILKINIDETTKKFSYENLMEKISDQHVIILKTSLLSFYEKNLPWGGLIGVRPTKVVKRLFGLGFSPEKTLELLQRIYLVSDEKSKLVVSVFQKELEFMNDKSFNIYIGIPFCPTKCKYCSFASYEIKSPVGKKFYKSFVETLLEEIKLTGEFIAEKNLRANKNSEKKIIIESIYIGGGTPSILEEKDLERILLAVRENIPQENLREFTFEAGREDTITDKKLETMKNFGVNRISLNPQTFNKKTLERMNRNFDQENFDRCYKKIRELKFIINMDLILGLPDETEKEILQTLETIKNYEIENLTIHNLALKKASTLFKDLDKKINNLDREKVEQKISEIILEKEMSPYYLYRQKNSADWGENIGYSKKGCESIFNIEMIEENQSTIGLGGGAITKKIIKGNSGEEREEIIRLVNPKDPATYIAEMKKRFEEKRKLFGEGK
ncbi:MAG: coproporphyrinogen III oxidase [Fusobacteriaceae bacterium]